MRALCVFHTRYRGTPPELHRDQQLAAARDFLQASFSAQHPYIWALHDPPAADGGSQPHVHVLWSARTLDGIERPAEQFFTRYNRAHPERGGAEKARELGHFGAVKAARVLYTDVLNLHLERAGRDERLHPDRLTARGFERAPEPRLAPSDSNARKFKQVITPAMQQVLDHRATRGPHAAAELAEARTYWEQRKQELGIGPGMPLAQQLDPQEGTCDGRQYGYGNFRLTMRHWHYRAFLLDFEGSQPQRKVKRAGSGQSGKNSQGLTSASKVQYGKALELIAG